MPNGNAAFSEEMRGRISLWSLFCSDVYFHLNTTPCKHAVTGIVLFYASLFYEAAWFIMTLNYFQQLALAASAVVFSTVADAAGIVPETSVVLVNAGDGEGSINVTNTDPHTVLLHTLLENVPEDPEELLLVTSPISRVEAGEKQLVRFVFQSDKALTTQRLKRVIFEGIPPQSKNGKATITMTVRQNLPVIISPADLPPNNTPWTMLKWELKDQTLTVHNDSRYVVRLKQQLDIIPAGFTLNLPRTYLLPGQFETITLSANAALNPNSKIRIYPASVYGYESAVYDAPLIQK